MFQFVWPQMYGKLTSFLFPSQDSPYYSKTVFIKNLDIEEQKQK